MQALEIQHRPAEPRVDWDRQRQRGRGRVERDQGRARTAAETFRAALVLDSGLIEARIELDALTDRR